MAAGKSDNLLTSLRVDLRSGRVGGGFVNPSKQFMDLHRLLNLIIARLQEIVPNHVGRFLWGGGGSCFPELVNIP